MMPFHVATIMLDTAKTKRDEAIQSLEETGQKRSKALYAVSCHSFFQIFVTLEHCLIFTKIVKTISAIFHHCKRIPL